MSIDEIQQVVIEVLREVQSLSGRACGQLKPQDRPIGTLEEFDSLSAIEATLMVEGRLACGDLKVNSLFVSDDGTRALSIREAAERITTLLPTLASA